MYLSHKYHNALEAAFLKRPKENQFQVTYLAELWRVQGDNIGWYRIKVATMIDFAVYRYWNGQIWFSLKDHDISYLHDNGGLGNE